MYLLGVLLMALGVALSIALHELGHLIPAKKFGVRVTQYMVGFGPTVWARRRGETEYGIKAVPLGGYIRMIGMLPPRPQDKPGQLRTASTGRVSQMADRAREDSFDEIGEDDGDRVFYKLPVWKKVVIMMGGPTVNLVIAAVLLVVIACGVGLPEQKSANVAGVNECLPVTVAAGEKAPKCTADNRSPAWKAGLKPGDEFVSVAGEPVTTSQGVTEIIRDRAEQAIPVVVERDGKEVTLSVTPVTREMPKQDDNGQQVLTMSGEPVMENVGLIGTSIGGTFVTERRPLTEGPAIVADGLKQTASVFLKIPQKMVGVAHAAFSDGQRDANGPISVVGVGRVAGEVTDEADSAKSVAVVLLMILASLNLALFVFNMIPLLPLDGGHIAGALWEGVKRTIARARGIEGPVYADVTKALPVAYGVSIVLVVMSVLLIYADIVNPISLN
ncbi:M50 family metallopeptidase [Demetria terragena]|uniref:M50 family metallopeptidase n=1 Tax=Demetria terragena TaxID=63959 RepID=UPI0003674600|nr:M50 family metallopeptidase [Demetria terragena]